MRKLLKNHLLWILSFLLFMSCSSQEKIMKQDNGSIVAISATSTGALQKGYGIEIILENIDTHERIKSKSLSSMSSHSIIQNIPPGKYIVYQVAIPVGNITYYNKSDRVKDFFGQIVIKPNTKYYLGNFLGERGIGKENVLTLRINDQNIPDKLKEKIEKETTGWKTGEFIKLYPYKKDVLLVY